MGAVSAVVDEVLEGSVVGSFSRVGYEVRRRLGDWSEPAAMPGRSVMVTGATSGLGFEAALRFARLGAAVTFVGRDQGRCEEARRSIAERSGSDRVEFLVADMADLDSIRSAAAAYCDQIATLDVLVHNAGMLTREYQQAPDCGVELTAAVHVLGPFLLTGLLLPALRRAAAETTHPARVLTVSSGGMYLQRFDLNRFDAGPTGFDGPGAYARAKRAQVVLGHAWADRIDPREVVFQTMHPGWADTPGVRSFGLAHVSPDRVVQTFPDLAAVIAECPRGCTHAADAPDCALDEHISSLPPDSAERAVFVARVDSVRRLLTALTAE